MFDCNIPTPTHSYEKISYGNGEILLANKTIWNADRDNVTDEKRFIVIESCIYSDRLKKTM